MSRVKRGRGKPFREEEKYKINEKVRAPEVRLIDDEGTMLGVMSSRDAFEIAQNKGLDLIEVAPNAKPPTCKIMDYGKWKYENKKKDKESRKNQTIVSVKEIQVRPRTEQNDLDVKLKHARKFLLEGSKVKVNLRFSGREMAHQDIGMKLLLRITKLLDPIASVEDPPKREGRRMHVILAPDATKIKDYLKAQKVEAKFEARVEAHLAQADDAPATEAPAAEASAVEAPVTKEVPATEEEKTTTEA